MSNDRLSDSIRETISRGHVNDDPVDDILIQHVEYLEGVFYVAEWG